MTLSGEGDMFFEQSSETFWPRLYPRGPDEMVIASFVFSLNPQDSMDGRGLYLQFDTLYKDIHNVFTDISDSPFHSKRTITHKIPLVDPYWLAGRRKTAIPLDWLSFLESEISALCTFSKELVDEGRPGQERVVRWKILSFETKWRLLLPPSTY